VSGDGESHIGFAEEDHKRLIMRKLNNISPTGKTALRDAIAASVLYLTSVSAALSESINAALRETGKPVKMKFINVVLTDGEDTGSEVTEEKLIGAMHAINRIFDDENNTYLVYVIPSI